MTPIALSTGQLHQIEVAAREIAKSVKSYKEEYRITASFEIVEKSGGFQVRYTIVQPRPGFVYRRNMFLTRRKTKDAAQRVKSLAEFQLDFDIKRYLKAQ